MVATGTLRRRTQSQIAVHSFALRPDRAFFDHLLIAILCDNRTPSLEQ